MKKKTIYLVCGQCHRTDEPRKSTHKLGHNTGTSITMFCPDCAEAYGRAARCRDCCPTGHGTRFGDVEP